MSRRPQTLITQAQALSRCHSILEAEWWRKKLLESLDKALSGRSNTHIEQALDALLEQNSPAYEALVEQAEACSESLELQFDGQAWQALLFSAPVLAWTRYRLPEGHLGQPEHLALLQLLSNSVFHPQARLCLIPSFVRFEHLPRTFQNTRLWTQNLAQLALGQKRDWPELKHEEELGELLADAFFLMGCVVVPKGEAIFRWQNSEANPSGAQDAAQQQWATGCAAILEPAFTGCQMECALPGPYYASTRLADQSIRPMTLKAAATWLQTASDLAASELRAALVACGQDSIEEYRIGFTTRDSNEVIYGCVWPTLSREEARPDEDPSEVDTWDTIAALLRECGIQDIRRLPGLQAGEVCEDCGTPFFPNMLGEMQHPELPEEIDPDPVQLH